jgi:cobalamin biosynthesis protein CobD/CbiB
VLNTLLDKVVENFIVLVLIGAMIIIVWLLAWVVVRWVESKNSTKLAELSIQSEKLAMIKRQAFMRELAQATMVLKDEEKDRLDAVREDIAVLSRRNLALMSEIEAKTTRLERGVEMSKMKDQAQRIYEQERKLFGNHIENKEE